MNKLSAIIIKNRNQFNDEELREEFSKRPLLIEIDQLFSYLYTVDWVLRAVHPDEKININIGISGVVVTTSTSSYTVGNDNDYVSITPFGVTGVKISSVPEEVIDASVFAGIDKSDLDDYRRRLFRTVLRDVLLNTEGNTVEEVADYQDYAINGIYDTLDHTLSASWDRRVIAELLNKQDPEAHIIAFRATLVCLGGGDDTFPPEIKELFPHLFSLK